MLSHSHFILYFPDKAINYDMFLGYSEIHSVMDSFQVLSILHSLLLLFSLFGFVSRQGLTLESKLPQPSKCWDYRCVSPHPTSEFL
jgi:hypothetical protein